jgi:hypothetical protein
MLSGATLALGSKGAGTRPEVVVRISGEWVPVDIGLATQMELAEPSPSTANVPRGTKTLTGNFWCLILIITRTYTYAIGLSAYNIDPAGRLVS